MIMLRRFVGDGVLIFSLLRSVLPPNKTVPLSTSSQKHIMDNNNFGLRHFDIIIGGGGAIGLSAAVALSLRGFKVLVIDKQNDNLKINPDFDGRNIALNNSTVRFLHNVGVWDSLSAKAQPINDILVSDGTLTAGVDLKSCLHFDATHIGENSFGYFVLNPDIHFALQEKIKKDPNITCIYNTQITGISYNNNGDNAGDYIHITDNHNITYHAKLLIAADGKHSFVRNYHNIAVSCKDFSQSAIVLALSHEKPHNGIAQELFLPSGPFAILPLRSNQTSIVWVESTLIAQALMNASKAVFMYELHRRFGDYLGELQIISQKFMYPLAMQIAKNIIAERTVLIGDAAHVIHPISGQGFNLGVRDIGYLCDILSHQAYAKLDIGSQIALKEYKNTRQSDIELFGNVTSSLNWLFSNNNAVLQSSRRLGLGIVQKIPTLRNFFANSAANGSIGTLPSLLRA